MDRFWSKVAVGKPADCWEWQAYTCKKTGYGVFRKTRQKLMKAHRMAYEITHGEIPEGEGWHGTVIRHTCDNRKCCNPAHLAPGTQYDNIQDRNRRGRTQRGRRNGSVKLTEDQAREIKALKGKKSSYAIAKDYPVDSKTIRKIHDNQIWRHV